MVGGHTCNFPKSTNVGHARKRRSSKSHVRQFSHFLYVKNSTSDLFHHQREFVRLGLCAGLGVLSAMA